MREDVRLCKEEDAPERIKLAQIRWAESTGGPERVLRDLAANLDRERFDMRFFFLGGGGPYHDELRAMGYPVAVIPALNGYDPLLRFRLIRSLRSFDPDLIHEHGIPPLVRPLFKWTTHASLLSFEHGDIEINRRKHRPWLNWLNGIEFRRWVDRVIVNSPANRDLVVATHRLKSDAIRVVQLGIDLTTFAVRPPGDEAPSLGRSLVLGYVGRIQNYDKGTDLLPDLLQHLIQLGLRDVVLRVVGDGPDLSDLRERAARAGVLERMEILGRRDDVAEFMASFDVLVVPSRTEAFGLVALEALAVGTRVVATAVGGLEQVLDGCPAARLVPPEDMRAMADAVESLWRCHGKTRTAEGPRYVADRFDARRMTLELEQVYESAFRREAA